MTRSFDASHIDPFASGAWPLLSWVSDGTRELCPRFGRGPWVVLDGLNMAFVDGNHIRKSRTLDRRSCCQFLVGEMLSNYRNYERVEPLQGVTAYVADVQAERELIHVAMQVLIGNLMVNAIHS